MKYFIPLTKTKKQVLLLYSSTIIGVFIGVLISILNTRNLCPSDYGDVRYINNIIGLFSGFFLFGYFVSGCKLLAVAKSCKEVQEIKGAMLAILFVTVLLMMLAILLCGFFYNFVLITFYNYIFHILTEFCNIGVFTNNN